MKAYEDNKPITGFSAATFQEAAAEEFTPFIKTQLYAKARYAMGLREADYDGDASCAWAPVMNDFIASRDLSPEDFEKFSEQMRYSLFTSRMYLHRLRKDVKDAERRMKYHLEQINETRRRALKHGVRL